MLSILERQFFATRVTSDAGTPLNHMKKQYLHGVVGGSNTDSIETLTKHWLRSIIVANAGTPTGNQTSDLLKQALSSLGLAVTNYEGQNWATFYRGYQG